jgi:hypothetical protein
MFEILGCRADNHEVLYIDAPPGMGTAAKYLNFRMRQVILLIATEISI